jgi:hypothetical protein
MNLEASNGEAWNPTITEPQAKNSAAADAKRVRDEAMEKLAAEMKVFNSVATELKGKVCTKGSLDERGQSVVSLASELFGLAPTWTAFYREVLGGEGLMRLAVPNDDEYMQFECSCHHEKLLEMLTALRSRDLPENDPHEQQCMITVRIPKSLHVAICDESDRLAVSVNKLCISRLLQKVDTKMIPSSSQKRRGRRPGSAAGKKLSSKKTAEEFRGLD